MNVDDMQMSKRSNPSKETLKNQAWGSSIVKAFPLSKNVKHQKAHKRPSSSCFWFVGERKCIWLEGISERGRPGATCSHGDQRSQGRHSHRPVWSNTIVEVFPHPGVTCAGRYSLLIQLFQICRRPQSIAHPSSA